MECKAYQFSREYQRAALVFLTNLTEGIILLSSFAYFYS